MARVIQFIIFALGGATIIVNLFSIISTTYLIKPLFTYTGTVIILPLLIFHKRILRALIHWENKKKPPEENSIYKPRQIVAMLVGILVTIWIPRCDTINEKELRRFSFLPNQLEVRLEISRVRSHDSDEQILAQFPEIIHANRCRITSTSRMGEYPEGEILGRFELQFKKPESIKPTSGMRNERGEVLIYHGIISDFSYDAHKVEHVWELDSTELSFYLEDNVFDNVDPIGQGWRLSTKISLLDSGGYNFISFEGNQKDYNSFYAIQRVQMNGISKRELMARSE